MAIKYDRNYFRAGATAHRLVMPGDDVVAEAYGFRKTSNIHLPYVDETAIRIARAVADKEWNVPGVDVEFRSYGSDDKPIHVVSEISGGEKGKKWSVRFSRQSHNSMDGWNVLTLPNDITIPKHEISMYNDGSGSYNRYVGNDWMADEHQFHHGSKVNSKLYKEKRTYLQYHKSGGTFVHTNDLGREYDPRWNEPSTVSVEKMLKKVGNFLENIADTIERMPRATDRMLPAHGAFETANFSGSNLPAEIETPHHSWARLAYIAPRPMPTGSHIPARGIVSKKTYSRNEDSNVVLSITGPRLVSLDYATKDMRDEATDAYSFMFQSLKDAEESHWADHPLSEDTQIFEVNLKYANDVFVADEEAYEKSRKEISDRDPKVERYTTEQMKEMHKVLADTLVPIDNYEGGYGRAMVCVRRPLWRDEVREITEDVRRRRETRDPQTGYRYEYVSKVLSLQGL